MSEDKKGLDVLGIQPIADSIKLTLQGVGTFLGKICLPAAEEFGLLLKDRISFWRAKNFAAIASKAEQMLESQGGIGDRHAPPRLVHSIMENGSWTAEDEVQGMWAGLLASSCTEGGRDDGNILFTNLLSQLTASEAKMLNHICSEAPKKLASNGLPVSEEIEISPEKLVEVSGVEDLFRLDRELDHLRSLDLISGGFMVPRYDNPSYKKRQEDARERRDKAIAEGKHDEIEKYAALYTVEPDDSGVLIAKAAPTAIALNLYVRTHGSQSTPAEFFGLA